MLLRSLVLFLVLGASGCRVGRAESATGRMSLAEASEHLCAELLPSGNRLCEGYVSLESGDVYRMTRIHVNGTIELGRGTRIGLEHFDANPDTRIVDALKGGDPGFELLRERFEEQRGI